MSPARAARHRKATAAGEQCPGDSFTVTRDPAAGLSGAQGNRASFLTRQGELVQLAGEIVKHLLDDVDRAHADPGCDASRFARICEAAETTDRNARQSQVSLTGVVHGQGATRGGHPQAQPAPGDAGRGGGPAGPGAAPPGRARRPARLIRTDDDADGPPTRAVASGAVTTRTDRSFSHVLT
jgi:hypothetical protein